MMGVRQLVLNERFRVVLCLLFDVAFIHGLVVKRLGILYYMIAMI